MIEVVQLSHTSGHFSTCSNNYSITIITGVMAQQTDFTDLSHSMVKMWHMARVRLHQLSFD